MKLRARIREIAAQKSMGGKITIEPSDETKRKIIDAQKAALERRLKELKR